MFRLLPLTFQVVVARDAQIDQIPTPYSLSP